MTQQPSVQIDLRLPAAPRICTIHIGAGLLEQCGSLATALGRFNAAAIVADSAIAEFHAKHIASSLNAAGLRSQIIPVQASEATKTLEGAAQLLSSFLEMGLDRSGLVVAVGGGIVTDLAGFAAATFMRGVPLVNVPTTLLGMVDAAIGGKTGVNHPLPGSNSLGKNLVGAFHHPLLVLMDVAALATLPDRAFRCGLAECIKHGVLADPELLSWMEANHDRLVPERSAELVEFIGRNVRIKADVVVSDERESNQRMLLNLGHTFAHALETRPDQRLEHGEAVGLGLLAACAAGEHLGLTSAGLRDRISELVGKVGLPTRLAAEAPVREVLGAMRSDKKSRAGAIRLIIPIDAGVVEIVDSAPDHAVGAGLQAIAP